MNQGRVTLEEVAEAVAIMSGIVPFFPQDEVSKRYLTASIHRFVDTRRHLSWLVDAACNRMRRFNLQELRGIYCARFRPADGLEAVAVETPGFTPADLEQRAILRESRETGRKLAEWKREQKLLGPVPQPVLAIDAAAPAIPEAAPPDRPRLTVVPPADRKARLRYAEAHVEARQKHRRSDEESARLVAELEAQLEARRQAG